MHPTSDFWQALEQLVAACPLVVDRPKGSCHPRYPDLVYEVDYGYLANTTAMDGGGIDVWRGTAPEQRLDAVIVTVDLLKRDVEIKLLLGCTKAEATGILRFHNESPYMKGMLLRRPDEE